MTALGTLAWLSNDLSNSRFLLQAVQIEKLARKSFTAGGGEDADLSKPGTTPDFYDRHPVQIPSSWPEKYALPVVVRDLSKPAQRLRLLALDEFVLAFWKTVGRVKTGGDWRRGRWPKTRKTHRSSRQWNAWRNCLPKPGPYIITCLSVSSTRTATLRR